MGLPAVAVLEEEIGARDDANSAAAPSGETTQDSADQGDARALIFEREARKALECPCLDDLRNGTCGKEFSKAFVCFAKSEQPEKGSDCVEPFKKMQHCMIINAKKFKSEEVSGAPVPKAEEGHRLPAIEEDRPAKKDASEDDDEDKKKKKEKEEEEEEDDRNSDLPQVPNNSIRLPDWYKKQVSENGG